MAIRLTQATLVDLETLFEMMRHMQEVDPWSEPFYEPTLRANLTELLANPVYGIVYIGLEQSLPIAYLVICFDYSLEFRGKGAWIDELFVEAAHRGKGIGTQLLDQAEAASREHHAKFLHLESHPRQPRRRTLPPPRLPRSPALPDVQTSRQVTSAVQIRGRSCLP
jgi:GNAT superfamily N-acetyltransferase